MKKLFLNGLGALMLSAGVYSNCLAQDIHFSQFYETSILRNPSLTGIFTGDYKVGAVYRNQWSSISKPYQTALVTVETKFGIGREARDFLSVGVLAYYDKAGSINMQTMTVYPAVNYNKLLNDEKNTFLSVGFTGGYAQRSFDPSKATFDNQYQNSAYSASNASNEQFPNVKLSYWDLGTGITYSSSGGQNHDINYFVGVAGYHLTTPKNSFYNKNINLDMKWNVNAGLSSPLSDRYSMQLHANYFRQGTYNEIIAGGLLGWNKKDESNGTLMFALFAGVFYRVNDALIPTLKLRYKDYSFAFNYDANVSSLKAGTNLRGGYELTVFKTGFINNPEGNKSRTICPEFY